jgi:hypothetical protein
MNTKLSKFVVLCREEWLKANKMALENSKPPKWHVATSIVYLSRELLNLASRGCTWFVIIFLSFA